MRKYICMFCLLLPFVGLNQNIHKACYAIQRLYSDTTKTDTTLIQLYNDNDNLIYDKYHDHRVGSLSRKNSECIYKYCDQNLSENLCVRKSLYSEDSCDSIRIEYLYQNNLLVKRLNYVFEARQKEKLECDLIKFPEDFYQKQWYLTNSWIYIYNDKGELIEQYDSVSYFSSQNKYIYEYYDSGELYKKYSYDGDRLIWTEIYSYSKSKKTMDRVWEPKKGTRKCSNTKHFKFISFLDDTGNVILKDCYLIKLEKKDEFFSSEKFEYDQHGRLLNHIIYDKERSPVVYTNYWCE